jgi:hypothetical protein
MMLEPILASVVGDWLGSLVGTVGTWLYSLYAWIADVIGGSLWKLLPMSGGPITAALEVVTWLLGFIGYLILDDTTYIQWSTFLVRAKGPNGSLAHGFNFLLYLASPIVSSGVMRGCATAIGDTWVLSIIITAVRWAVGWFWHTPAAAGGDKGA